MEVEDLWNHHNVFYNIIGFLISENEKLFSRSDVKLYWKTVFHTIMVSHHVNTSIYASAIDLQSHDEVEIQTLKTYRFGYLTGWNFGFQMTFLALALVHDLLEWTGRDKSTLGKKIGYLRDVVFNGLLVPYTWFVTCMFWTLWWIDRELVFPEIFDAIVPFWFNHCVHTNIFIIFWIETVLQPRRKPTDFKIETICYATIGIVYAIVYYSIFFISGRFLYRVFAIMTWWQVVLFQCLIWLSSYVFYTMHFPLNRLFHGKGEKADSEVLGAQNGGAVEEVRTGKEADGNRGHQEGVSERETLNGADHTFSKSWSREYRSSRGQDDTIL